MECFVLRIIPKPETQVPGPRYLADDATGYYAASLLHNALLLRESDRDVVMNSRFAQHWKSTGAKLHWCRVTLEPVDG